MLDYFTRLNYKKILKAILSIVVVLVAIKIGPMALAGDATISTEKISGDQPYEWIAHIIVGIFQLLIWLVGKLFTMMVDILISLASMDNFIDARAVVIGWVLVRDVANIFFIVAMLLIAFGTLFNIQSYEYKKLLPKLIIAAVLVNFSKMIVGVFIDLGQVVMMAFVNAFESIAADNLMNALGVESMLQLKSTLETMGATDAEINMWSIAGSVALAFILLTIALVVILSLVLVLLGRIIMLWVLIVLSPLAFVMSALPQGLSGKMSFFSQYWGQLSKYIIVGPVLAFFLWLSFGTMMMVDKDRQQHIIMLARGGEGQLTRGQVKTSADYVHYMASEISDPRNMFDYMVAIALLVGSLMITQQMGVMGGNFGMQAVGKLKGMGIAAAKWAMIGKKGKDGERTGGLWGLVKYGDSHLAAKTGFAPITSTKEFIGGVKERMEWNRQKRKLEAKTKAGDNLRREGGGMGSIVFGIGTGRDAADMMLAGGFLNRKGFANIRDRGFRGGRWEDIEKQKKEEEDNVEFLKVKKRRGDPVAAYKSDLENTVKENQAGINDSEQEMTDLRALEHSKMKEHEKAEKDGDPRADEILEEWMATQGQIEKRGKEVEAENGERQSKVNLAQQELGEIREAETEENEAVREEKMGKIKEKAIKRYKDEAEQNRKDAQNLREGKLTKAEVDNKAADFIQTKNKLDEIAANIKKEKDKAPGDRNNLFLAQLDKDSKREVAKLNELKEALQTDSDGKVKKDGEGNYLAREDYRIKDEKLRKQREVQADNLEGEAKVTDRLANEAETNWARGKEAVNPAAIDRLIEQKLLRVKDLSQEQVKYQAPQTFYSDQARRALVAEEEKKITSDNWEEQLAAMQDALKEGNQYKFEANFKAAAKRGNENEIMDQLGFLNAFRGAEDDVTPTPWKGQGMEAFRKHYMVNKLGMSEQESMGAMDDVAYIGEGVGHWSVARGYGIKGGRRYAKTWDRQQEEVYAEQSKLDGRKLFRSLNRLGHGGEVPQLDGSRDYQLEPYAIRRFLTSFEDVKGHIRNKEYSKSTAEKIAASPVAQAQLMVAANMLSGRMKQAFLEMVNMMNEYGVQSERYKRVEQKMNMDQIMSGIDFSSRFHSY